VGCTEVGALDKVQLSHRCALVDDKVQLSHRCALVDEFLMKQSLTALPPLTLIFDISCLCISYCAGSFFLSLLSICIE